MFAGCAVIAAIFGLFGGILLGRARPSETRKRKDGDYPSFGSE
jgi:hypothetical protein